MIRQFITSLLVVLIVLTGCSQHASAKEKNIGLQLYSLRDDINTLGIEKVLDKVAAIGYNSIELAGYLDGLIYGMDPHIFKQMANDKGLAITSSHVVRFLSDQPENDIAYWTETIKNHAEIGVEYIVTSTLPWWGKTEYSQEDVDKVVSYFNEIGKIAADYGVTFCFHNHNHVFNIIVDNKSLYSIMLEELNPDYVAMQMDVYWFNKAGQSPEEYLKKYKGHYPLLHIKDDAVIGESGKLDFKSIFKAAYKQGMEAFFVEVEFYKNSPLEDTKASYDFLNNASYVK